jgi:hypothetical protein
MDKKVKKRDDIKEQVEGADIEAAEEVADAPVVHPGKCPTCGRDR